jgi:ribosomal protein L6P/L9E
MAEPEVDAAWRAEFERVGEDGDRGSLSRESNRQPAFRWLGDQAEVQRLSEERAHHYLRWTVLALIAAMIVGLIAFGLTFLH